MAFREVAVFAVPEVLRLWLVVEAVRPHRCGGRGTHWRLLVARHDDVAATDFVRGLGRRRYGQRP
jgi:hypothetical protein